jgi:hypothetical protein
MTPQVSGKTVTFEYKQLKYNTLYEFWLDGNTVSDLTGNTLSEPVTFHFTTMSRPVIEKCMYDFVVPTDGDIAAAIKAANGRSNKQQRYRIFVMDGTHVLPFSETATIHSDDGNTYASPITYISAPNISFIGESMRAPSSPRTSLPTPPTRASTAPPVSTTASARAMCCSCRAPHRTPTSRTSP